jgi:hypothetical protein
MSNSLLTPTDVTRESLRVLHQKLNFIGSINRSYDDSFANEGAKIGDTLKVRLPNQYSVRTGRVMDVNDTAESSVSLQVSTQKGVDLNFTSADLTMDLDDFSDRIIQPAMAVLAANIEADALSMYKDVYQEVSDVGASVTFNDVLLARKKLVDSLVPAGSDMNTVCLDTTANVDLVDTLKGLFHDQKEVAKQYREGYIGKTSGFSFMENTLLPIHTTGTDDGTGDYVTNGADQTGSTLTVNTGTGTFKKGDIITVDDVYRVHPETKTSTGKLMQFVVTADVDASATSIPISPAIVASGAKQNVNAAAGTAKAVRKRESDESTAIGASADYNISLAYHRDAFTFATADLVMPKGVDFSARETMDGISLRIVRDYDINNDQLPCRIDVLYGYKAIRPEMACRLGFN